MHTWNLLYNVFGNSYVGLDNQRPGVHGAHALEVLAAAGVELLVHGRVAIDEQLQLGLDLASDVGDALDLEVQTAVVGRQDDIEEGC